MKRKFDRILCREKPESSKPSVKDRRLSDSLSQNNIVDLPNSGHSSQKSTVLEFELLVNESAFEALPNLHPKVAKCNTKIFTKPSEILQVASLSKSVSSNALYIYLIISLILNEHSLSPKTFDISMQSMELSEQDYYLIWDPLIGSLFSGTCVEIKSGDTALSNIDKGYMVNCRLGIMVN
ncbi:hypothetical protein HMPREF1544_00782 [Mucor circinelloides 1006PhL]|uniref:Uncharacterized protein n=1 Tax=Mucor circinelloides f. circinelloides (strain 1006PhL) TaxID=1220926 RepID=S2JR73_MUCC1|nr:hypothetical protein HMPREF1544_00782 [Mucor circinelloides 1006PhL]